MIRQFDACGKLNIKVLLSRVIYLKKTNRAASILVDTPAADIFMQAVYSIACKQSKIYIHCAKKAKPKAPPNIVIHISILMGTVLWHAHGTDICSHGFEALPAGHAMACPLRGPEGVFWGGGNRFILAGLQSAPKGSLLMVVVYLQF
ncbi:MAG: hypothetical protein LBJ12_08890 [Oscillospiraceae bacterium]|nr:hypothetical protein [Oscillospiraceae bacterium]